MSNKKAGVGYGEFTNRTNNCERCDSRCSAHSTTLNFAADYIKTV